MNPFQVSADDVADFQCELGDDCPVIAWGTPSQNYKLIPGYARLRRTLAEGGFNPDFDFQAIALVATFVNGKNITDANSFYQAAIKTSFQYQGQWFRFESIEILAGATMVRISGNAAKKQV